MNRKFLIWFLGGLLLLIVIMWMVDSPSDGSGPGKKFVSSQWDDEYGIYSRDPKGLGFFSDLLETHVADSIYAAGNYFELDTLKNLQKATLLYIGDGLDLKKTELEKLLIRVDSGATLFMSYNRSDKYSYEAFFNSNAYYWEYTTKAYVALGDTSLAFSQVNQNDTVSGDWYTFEQRSFRDTLAKAFLHSMYHPVAVEFNRGKGKVILHSMPQLFFNYQVLQPNGFAHAAYCLRKIRRKEPVVWLEFARYIQPTEDDYNEEPEPVRDSSYLQFIMKHEALRWAFLLTLLVFFFYVLFRAKRRQAVIPGIPEKRNMSLAFVDTLTSIYLSRNSPYSLLLVMRKNFFITVSRHFYIDLIVVKTPEQQTQQDLNIKRLREKSKSDNDDLDFILKNLSRDALRSHTINNQTLAQLHKAIRKFYLENGIMKAPEHFLRENEEVVLHRSILVGGSITLAGMLIIMRGMYLLAAGNGMGILLVIASAAALLFGIRFLVTPVAKITRKSLTLFNPVYGKKTIEIPAGEFTFITGKEGTVFFTGEGKSLTIKHNLLTKNGRRRLKYFTEHLKRKES